MRIILLSILCSASVLLSAQQTGVVQYKELGVQFSIPNGWVGQESEAGFVMGHQSIPGLVLITSHNYTMEQLIQEAHKGIADQQGTRLQLTGQLKNWSTRAVGGEFQGTLEWQPAKAYIIGMANDLGMGISIMIMTTTEHFK